jgi:YbbR domain-containing protein
VTTTSERRWTRFITDNLGLKLLALALSLLLFSLVHSDVDAQRSMFIDVVALLPPADAGRMLVSELPTQVKVTLRGSRSRLSDLSRDDFSPIQLDLREGESGYYYFRPDEVDIAGGVQVVEIEPASVPLTWAPTGRKQVAVHPRIEGKLEEHHRLRAAGTARPATVFVRGPKTTLEELSTVSTEALSINGVGIGEHTRRVALAPLPKLVTYEGDAYVEVQLDVEPIVAERTLRRLEVAALGAPAAALRPDRVSVTLRGPQDALSELDPEQVVPFIELQSATSTYTAHDVKLRGVPDTIEVLRVAPSSVLARSATPKGSP